MTHEESVAEAVRLLTEAGSSRVVVSGSHPNWLVACDWGTSATSDEDHNFDEPHECAAALVAALGKSGQDAAHETDSEIVPESAGEAPVVDLAEPDGSGQSDDGAIASGPDILHGSPGPVDAGGRQADADPTDADFAAIEGADLDPLALPEPEPEDFAPDEIDLGAEILEDGPSFIFGPPADDTEALRSQRIGDVVRIALERMPTITPEDDAALMELRNFAMGVSEGRWPNDADKQAALEALEAVVSLQRLVEAERDARVAFLVTADRPALDAFKAEEGWP